MLEEIKTPDIITKGWGYEKIFVNDEKYCFKILHFNQYAKLSMHFHMKKDETWFIKDGHIILKWINTETADLNEKHFFKNDTIRIRPGVPHQIIAIEDTEIFEVSTQHFDNDSYRINKGDSQI